MPFLIRVSCPVCARDYRYSSDAPEEETLCPYADCGMSDDPDPGDD